MPAFPALPLGQPIPASPHAVSCSLPTMAAVRGYEEKDPEVSRHLTTGYPRFVVHPYAVQLAEHLGREPVFKDRKLWLTCSARVAQELGDFIRRSAAGHQGGSGIHVFDDDGLHGVAHRDLPGLALQAKLYLQHVGGFLSSREAEDHLVRLRLRRVGRPGEDLGRRPGRPGAPHPAAGPGGRQPGGPLPHQFRDERDLRRVPRRRRPAGQARTHDLGPARLALPRHDRDPEEVHRRPGQLPLRGRRPRPGRARAPVRRKGPPDRRRRERGAHQSPDPDPRRAGPGRALPPARRQADPRPVGALRPQPERARRTPIWWSPASPSTPPAKAT